ncbi:MAG: FAD-dependent oxidoreductase [candidate division WOR-3 bacterium]|nr:FAD-dependent oxidoreductase [candidate division WOR-3 bacterium]
MMSNITININGKDYQTDSNNTVLLACREAGIDIPTLCYHEQLEPYGSCFLCTVEIKGAKTRYTVSCGTKVRDGMEVRTDTKEIWNQRKMALELLMSNHYADCRAPCYNECPSNVDVQAYIAAIAEGNYHEAIKIIKETNPFPAVCGRVCTRPCEDECRRNLVDSKVGIDFLKRYASDKDLASQYAFTPDIKESKEKKIAVIGAGPSGLSAAYYLAIEGYDIDIFEMYEKAGGMLRYGIPQYRLPDDVLDTEIKQITDLGPEIHYNQRLGRDFTLDELKENGYDSIYIAIGAHECMYMGIENDDAEGSWGGIDLLRDAAAGKDIDLGKDVVVVGGGNTAIDAARVSRRLGCNVSMVYRRTVKEMPAHDAEIEDAQEEGIDIKFLTNPVKVIKDSEGKVEGIECIKMELGKPDSSGRRRPIPIEGSEFTINADSVVFAIGQKSDIKCISTPSGEIHKQIEFTDWKTVITDEKTFMTDAEGVFAGGDFRRGADTVIGGIADGKKAAWVIDKYLQSGEVIEYPEEFYSKKDNLKKQLEDDYTHFEEKEKQAMPKLSADERIKDFREVEKGFTDRQAQTEADRCLECGCKAVFNCELKDASDNYEVQQDKFFGEFRDMETDDRHPYIIFEPNKCISCARCIRMCKEVLGLSVLGFENRGFKTVVRPAMNKPLRETDCISCGLCADACPTGAIVIKPDTAKPGPFKLETAETVCPFCSYGCRIEVKKIGNKIVSVKGKEDSETNLFGNICKRGRFGFIELNKAAADKTSAIAAQEAADKVIQYINDNKPAIIAGETATFEELSLLKAIASAADLKLLPAARLSSLKSTVTYNDAEAYDNIIMAGINPFEDSPMIMPTVNRARKNGAQLAYFGKENISIMRISGIYEITDDYNDIDKHQFEGKTVIISSHAAMENNNDAVIAGIADKHGYEIIYLGRGANASAMNILISQSGSDAGKALYYLAHGDNGLVMSFINPDKNDRFIRINTPYAEEGIQVNSEYRAMKRKQVIKDLEFSNRALLELILDRLNGSIDSSVWPEDGQMMAESIDIPEELSDRKILPNSLNRIDIL